MQGTRLLIADTDRAEMERLGVQLAACGCVVSFATDADELAGRAADADAVLVGLSFAGDGLETAERLQAARPDLTVLLLGAGPELARCSDRLVSARCPCFRKPVLAGQVLPHLRYATEFRRLREENGMLRGQWEDGEAPDDLISHSPVMIDALRQAATAADTDEPVVIYGPPGTETDVLALYIHRCSERAHAPFVRFLCGRENAADEEALLFGDRNQAAAPHRRTGRIELAVGGTLFLGRVAQLTPPCQARLLRFIEEGCAVPGANGGPNNVRLICTGAEDPAARLRQDLMFRLNALSVTVPPLVDRPEDVLPLATRFLRRFAAEASRPVRDIGPAARQLLDEYDWPGNIAELRETIRTAVYVARGEVIAPEDLLRGPSRRGGTDGGGVTGPSIEDAERQLILKTLDETRGNKSEAARRLRITKSTLLSRLARYRASGLLLGEAVRC